MGFNSGFKGLTLTV